MYTNKQQNQTIAILEGVPYINGSPQNTFVPGVVEVGFFWGEKGKLTLQ